MDTKALNEKLLKFAGLEFKDFDLVHSLDAQSKWLYPKLENSTIIKRKDYKKEGY